MSGARANSASVIGWVGIVVIILTVLAAPTMRAALGSVIVHPTLQNVGTLLGFIAGETLVWIGKSPFMKGR